MDSLTCVDKGLTHALLVTSHSSFAAHASLDSLAASTHEFRLNLLGGDYMFEGKTTFL